MSHTNSFSNTNSFIKVWNNCTITDDRSHILTWLSPLESRLRHRDIQERRIGNAGEGLLQTKKFGNRYAGGGRGESNDAVCFAMGIRESAKLISPFGDRQLVGWGQRKDIVFACFYFDFAVQKERSPTSMLGAILKHMKTKKGAIGRRGPQLSRIVKMLRTISPEKPTFICIDALDECLEGHRVKLLDSLDQILQKSPGTRVFATGRPHTQPETGRRLAGRATSLCISPKRGGVIRYLRIKLGEDTNSDAMDSSLEADILEKKIRKIYF